MSSTTPSSSTTTRRRSASCSTPAPRTSGTARCRTGSRSSSPSRRWWCSRSGCASGGRPSPSRWASRTRARASRDSRPGRRFAFPGGVRDLTDGRATGYGLLESSRDAVRPRQRDRRLVTATNDPRPRSGEQAAAVTNGVVALLRDYLGRGPTRAKTILNDDAAMVLLSDTLTRGEQRLVADGEQQAVLDLRRRCQSAMRDDLVSAVEGIVGRRVAAFMSDNSMEPDVMAEIFVFEPPGDGNEPGR